MPASDLSVDDWITFYEGGTRLAEYLHYVGYNGLMLSVFADGSTIYPSALVEPTPRYDTGVFFTTGQDPVRKDVLEMLLRVFDREGLQLIPAVEFASPLPELEAVLRRGGPEAEGLVWTGPDGDVGPDAHAASRPGAVLQRAASPGAGGDARRGAGAGRRVRRAIRRLPGWGSSFRPTATPSCSGRAWGVDDATIARFERDTKLRVPGEGPGRFAERARFLAGEGRREWLDWRAAQLNRFYRRVQAELAARAQRSAAVPRGHRPLVRRRLGAGASPRLAAENDHGGDAAPRGHRHPALRRRRGDRAHAARADRPRLVACPPGRRPGDPADARRGSVLPVASRFPGASSSTSRRRCGSRRSTRNARTNRATPGWRPARSPRTGRTGGDGCTAWRVSTPRRCSTAGGCCRWARRTRSATSWPCIANCRRRGWSRSAIPTARRPGSRSRSVTGRGAIGPTRTWSTTRRSRWPCGCGSRPRRAAGWTSSAGSRPLRAAAPRCGRGLLGNGA